MPRPQGRQSLAARVAPPAPQRTPARADAPRGPNAKRRAATRQKLLDATIQCLFRYGYFGTSTVLVTEVAGVSRGSLLHQFPTKTDLMVATAEYISATIKAEHHGRLGAITDDREKFRAIPAVSWELFASPLGIARIELALASRSDPEFAERMTPLMERVDAGARNTIWGLASRLGVTNREKVDTMVRLYIAAVRGLAIDRLYDYARPHGDDAIALLSRYNDWFLEELRKEASPSP